MITEQFDDDRINKFNSYENLWLAVIEQAFKDLFGGRSSALPTWRWFYSKKYYIGSFRWICEIFNLQQTFVLEEVKKAYYQKSRREKNK